MNMNDIYIARTMESPEVDFKFSNNTLSLTGEAYPENAGEFFNPLLYALKSYLAKRDGILIQFNFRLTYFNSASTKMLYSIFSLLNETACTRNQVVLNWHHDEDDDTILEYGEAVKDDFNALEVNLVEASMA